jgi:hypothetical protein
MDSSTNIYNSLRSLPDTECDTDSEAETKTPSNIKPPPITVVEKPAAEIEKFLIQKGFKNFYIKLCSLGVRIITSTLDEHKKIFNSIVEYNSSPENVSKFQMFSHSTKLDKHIKVVLYGLENSHTEKEVFDELKKFNIQVVEVHIMNITKQRYSQQRNFIIHIKNNSTKLNELRLKVKYLFRRCVKWEFYTKKAASRHILCYNCQSFGHGARFCHKTTLCGICSKAHKTPDCPELIKPKEQQKIKCANCKLHHKPTSTECTTYKNYVKIIENARSKNQNNFTYKQKRPSQRTNLDVNNPHMFPDLSSANKNRSTATTTTTFNNSSTCYRNPHASIPSYSNVLSNNAFNVNNNNPIGKKRRSSKEGLIETLLLPFFIRASKEGLIETLLLPFFIRASNEGFIESLLLPFFIRLSKGKE